MPKISTMGVTAGGRSIKQAWMHAFQHVWAPDAHPLEVDRVARAAKLGCIGLALTSVPLFGIAERSSLLPMAAPLVGLGLAAPLVVALWMSAISPHHARRLGELAAVLLAVLGAVSFERAVAFQVIFSYFVPSLLLLRASEEFSG